jgi:Family of unknown function (DUF5317)
MCAVLRACIVLGVIVIARLSGGSLRHFASLVLRWPLLIVASITLQLLIFTPFREESLVQVAVVPIYLLSMVLLVIWVWFNRHIPGITLIALGIIGNLAAIVANGGYMPVDPDAARYAGNIALYENDVPVVNNSYATDDQVKLWFLTDIFPIPQGIPFANVLSLGDMLLTTGICMLCYQTIRGNERTSHDRRAESHR